MTLNVIIVEIVIITAGGFTAYCFNWLKELMWIEAPEMTEFLESHTKEIKSDEVQKGDILVFYYSNDEDFENNYDNLPLCHTGIVLKPGKKLKIIHKPGMGDLAIESLEEVKKTYKWADPIVSFARLIA